MLRNKRVITLPSSKKILTVINKGIHNPCPLVLVLRNFWMAITAFLYQNDLNIQVFLNIALTNNWTESFQDNKKYIYFQLVFHDDKVLLNTL